MREKLRRRSGRSFILLFAVGTALGLVVVRWAIGFMPRADAHQGQVVDKAIFFLAYLIVPVFVFATLTLIFAATVWRVREDDTADSEYQRRSHRGVTLGWLGATLSLAVLVTVTPGVTGIAELASYDHRTPGTLVVDVTAQQWEWSFAYPQYHVSYSDTLVLPVNRPVEFVLKSKDVVHAFWIPSMRVKEDVIPGETRTFYLIPDRLTSTGVNPMTRVQCSQLCGIGHTQMWAPVRVVRAGQFSAWSLKQAKVSPPMG